MRQLINQRYVVADQYFSTLLNTPESTENGKGQEVITMAVLLSLQDVRIIAVVFIFFLSLSLS
jgi:hypothetical protein